MNTQKLLSFIVIGLSIGAASPMQAMYRKPSTFSRATQISKRFMSGSRFYSPNPSNNRNSLYTTSVIRKSYPLSSYTSKFTAPLTSYLGSFFGTRLYHTTIPSLNSGFFTRLRKAFYKAPEEVEQEKIDEFEKRITTSNNRFRKEAWLILKKVTEEIGADYIHETCWPWPRTLYERIIASSRYNTVEEQKELATIMLKNGLNPNFYYTIDQHGLHQYADEQEQVDSFSEHYGTPFSNPFTRLYNQELTTSGIEESQSPLMAAAICHNFGVLHTLLKHDVTIVPPRFKQWFDEYYSQPRVYNLKEVSEAEVDQEISVLREINELLK